MVSGTDNAKSAAAEAPASAGALDPQAAEPTSAARRPGPRAGSRDARIKEGNVGSALRSVYQQTVNEDVPDDLMQLLGKLS